MSIEHFAYEWFNHWQIGKRGPDGELINQGILLLISKNDRKARIELGADWSRRFDARRVLNGRLFRRRCDGELVIGMTNAGDILTDTDRQRIAEAITQLEAKSSAEVVCAVSTESGRYDRAESIVGLFVALVVLGLAKLVFGELPTDSAAGWGDTVVQHGLAFGWQALAVVVGFVGGSLLAALVQSRMVNCARVSSINARPSFSS